MWHACRCERQVHRANFESMDPLPCGIKKSIHQETLLEASISIHGWTLGRPSPPRGYLSHHVGNEGEDKVDD